MPSVAAGCPFFRLLPKIKVIVIAGIEPVINSISEGIALKGFAYAVARELHTVEHLARLADFFALLPECLQSAQSFCVVDIIVVVVGQGYCSVAYARSLGENIFHGHLRLCAARKSGVYMQIVAGELVEVKTRCVDIHNIYYPSVAFSLSVSEGASEEVSA